MAPEDDRIPESYPPSEFPYYPSSGLAGDPSRVRVDSGVGVALNDVSTTASSEALHHPQVDRLPRSEGDYEEWTRFITAVPGQFGRFNIKFTLPIHGGFSDVWQGNAKLSDGRIIPVAVKKFRAVRVAAGADENAITHKLLKRLTNELGIWMAVQHPNIAPVIGFFLLEGLGIISPWYANGNVATYISRHPEVDRVKLVSDVAQGLAYLHGLYPPVVHGDLKPDNVLIANTGSAVIIDFGLSSIIEHGTESAVAASSTTASTSLQDAGNIRWMAPELLMEGSCTRSPPTDVYSFGSVALYIYTGKLPFTRITKDWQIPIALHKGQNPVAHRDEYTALFAPGIEWLCKLLLSCWDIEPDLRPSMEIAQETVRARDMKGSSLPRRSDCRHNPPYHITHVTTKLDFDAGEDDECPLPRP